ncbi:Adapter protein [Dirofilaria immitis]
MLDISIIVEYSSSLSSGISENFDDISTDDLTGSSLSDYPMVATTATAYGRLGGYQNQHHQQLQQQYVTTTNTRQPQVHAKRSSSHTGATTNALRLQQRRMLERENIDQLLQKCRTNYRGIACNTQASPRYNDCGQHAIYHTLGSSGGSGGGGGGGHSVPVPQLTLSDDGDTLCVRSGSTRGSLRMPSKQDHQVQAGPGFTSMAGYHSLDRKTHLLNYYRIPDDNPYRLAVVGQETSAATLAMVSPRHVSSNRQQFTLTTQQQQQQQQQNMDHTLAMTNRHSVADSSSLSSGISENFDDISTDDLTGSSLSDYPMVATTATAYGRLGGYQNQHHQQLQQQYVTTTNTRQPQVHAKRSSSHTGATTNALRLQQRRMLERENIDQLLQKCRTNYRGIACNTQASPRYNDCGQHAIYHTLGSSGGSGGGGGGGHSVPVPQLTLSDDGDTLCVRSGSTRGSLRMPSKQDHQVQAGPGFTSMAGYHSLDRKTHLLNYYRIPDDNPYRLAVVGQETSAATLAMVSPRHVSSNRQQFTLTTQQQQQQQQQNMDHTLAMTNRHSVAGSSLSSRKSQMENAYANYAHRDANLQLHKLSDDGIRTPQMKTSRYAESGYLSAASKLSPSGSAVEANDSQLSLTSSSNSLYSSMEEKYEAEIRKLNREMQAYRSTITKLTAKHDGYNHIIQVFESKLQLMAKHVENLQNKSQLKKDEVLKLRAEIEQLRVMSINAGVNVSGIATITQHKSSSPQSQDGAGELLRHPSLESVTSHRSSMSSSSKGSKTDKSSLNSFGKQGKKSWIRSSFSKFTKSKKAKSCSVSDAEHSPMHTSGSPSSLKPISGSVSRLDELETVPQVVELKKQLEDKDSALTDVRLDALDKAREVDILKETINRLKNENKILKQNYTMLERRMRAESRTSSQQSLAALPDEDPVYEMLSNSERCLNGRGSNCLKVTVSVDFSGLLRPRSSAGEVSIGFIPLPTLTTTWENFDAELFKLFDDYMAKIDSNRTLELNSQESIIGYEFGDFIRDIETNSAPSPIPADVLTHNHDIRIYLRGVTQRSVDGLVMDCLFPRSTIELLLNALLQNRRLVLFGATGIGKSNLARLLARYLCIKIGGTLQNTIVDIKIGDDDNDRNMAQVQKQLESLLRSTKPVIILLDNIQRHRIAFLSSSFNTVDTPSKEGPYVICTVNRASQLPELEIQHNFRMFLLPNNIDAIRGYMGRFLRRRILEHEFGSDERSPPEIYRVVEFLPRVLSSVNSFIEKANSRDVTIGPRLFLQCPLSVMQSREWFIKLWNQMIIPYMIKVAKEGVKVLGRCGSFEDPTDFVCEQWPWLEGSAAEQVLQRLSPIKESMSNQPNSSQFDPLEALIRIQANNANSQQEVVQ